MISLPTGRIKCMHTTDYHRDVAITENDILVQCNKCGRIFFKEAGGKK